LRRSSCVTAQSADVARVLAQNCAGAERDGAHSHGVFRIPGYVSTLQERLGERQGRSGG
jgi:LDH2 family malate/lactate/ureidoglycolate dehydrogenase